MRITTELVKTFNPCNDRFNNYQTNYPNSDLHITEFLKLENITYNDKIWVWKKVATINEAALFGLKCADSVLHIFENKYPEDKRPRLALDSVRTYLDNPTEENKKACRTAAYAAAAAADAAADAYAYAAAAAAADAAADAYAAYAAAAAAADAAADAYAAAADAAADAYAAAAYAAADAYAYAAAAAAADAAADARKTQREKNIQFLIEIYEGK
jgi:hypothetical protein